MSQKSFNSMNQMPSHGNASNAKVGNAREGYTHGQMGQREGMQMGQREGMQMRQREGMQHMGQRAQCSFPQPPPRRVYCHPAPFTATDGRTHFRLIDAYGSSMPSSM